MEKDSGLEKTKARRLFLLALLFCFLYLVFLIFQPYLGTLIFAVVLTSICHPFHRRFLQRCKGRKNVAAFLAVWSLLVVGSIDNFLRPLLMKGEGGISSIYLFFAILGGIHLFGIVGILYGPLILGVTAILLYLYELEYSEVLAEK